MHNKGQVFSTDIIIAMIIFIFIIISSAWFWDTAKEKMHQTEVRNDLELAAHNAVSVLIGTVGDPPNWNNLTFTDRNIYSLGIGGNRPWIIDEHKASRLGELNATDYDLIKRILGIRGSSYEFYLNISKYNPISKSFSYVSLVGKKPNSSSSHVININRIAISDLDNHWVSFNMQVWNACSGAECY